MSGGYGPRLARGGAAPFEVNAQRVLEQIRDIVEPEYGRSIVSLGLVRAVHIRDGGARVVVEMTLSSPRTPHGLDLIWAVKRAVLRLPRVREARVKLVWGMPWEPGLEFPSIAQMASRGRR